MVRSMAVSRQVWCWRSWEFYFLFWRQPEDSFRQLGGTSQSLRQQWHTSSNKAKPTPTRPHLLIVPLPHQAYLNHYMVCIQICVSAQVLECLCRLHSVAWSFITLHFIHWGYSLRDLRLNVRLMIWLLLLASLLQGTPSEYWTSKPGSTSTQLLCGC